MLKYEWDQQELEDQGNQSHSRVLKMQQEQI